MSQKHLHSIHVSHYKHTAGCATEVMPVPDVVKISMSQHIGAPCKPLVQKGDYVKVGQLIGDTDAFVSAPIHSSVSGTVTGIEEQRSAAGGMDTLVVIETDKKQEVYEGIKVPEAKDLPEFIKAIRESGLVGLGGASFPTKIPGRTSSPYPWTKTSIQHSSTTCSARSTTSMEEHWGGAPRTEPVPPFPPCAPTTTDNPTKTRAAA